MNVSVCKFFSVVLIDVLNYFEASNQPQQQQQQLIYRSSIDRVDYVCIHNANNDFDKCF